MPNFNRSGRGGGKPFGNRDYGKRDFGDRADRPMHKATCGECGSSCEVPFRPSGDRPVYCNNCFKKGDNGGNQGGNDRTFNKRDFGSRDFSRDSRPGMHKATCSDCGITCEVPFRPTGDKPVYCSNCFKKGDSNSGPSYNASANKGLEKFQAQLQGLNEKMDKILALLSGTKPTKNKEVAEGKAPVEEKTKAPKAKEAAPEKAPAAKEAKAEKTAAPEKKAKAAKPKKSKKA